jgi:hypothetical protein
VSTGMCRLRPSYPRRSPKGRQKTPFLSAFRRLGIDDRDSWACFSSFLLAHRYVKRMMDTLQRAIPVPELETVVHRALLGRQVLRQCLPLAAGPQHVENPVQYLAHVHRAFAPSVPGRRDHGFYDCPFGIGQITWVTTPVAACWSGIHMRRSFAKQAPNNESHPILPIQELPGSALRA